MMFMHCSSNYVSIFLKLFICPWQVCAPVCVGLLPINKPLNRARTNTAGYFKCVQQLLNLRVLFFGCPWPIYFPCNLWVLWCLFKVEHLLQHFHPSKVAGFCTTKSIAPRPKNQAKRAPVPALELFPADILAKPLANHTNLEVAANLHISVHWKCFSPSKPSDRWPTNGISGRHPRPTLICYGTYVLRILYTTPRKKK